MELLNGNAWLCTEKLHLTLTAFTDASSRRWGGIFRGPEGIFQMEGDFAEEQVGLHINVKEAVALEASLRLFCEKINEKIKGKIVVVNVDNQVLFHI